MDEPRRSGLREARQDRGWTQEEAADQLARLAWVRRGERAGVTADMIAKWERGEKSPSPRYRELLCLLYGATPEYLGIASFTRSKTSASPVAASPAVTEQSLVDALGGAAAILDQLGTAGGILQPRMFDAWKDDVMQRRAVLKLLGIMPTVTALPSVAESARRSRSGKPTPENVRDLEYLADRYQTLYHSTAPTALMTPVVAHLSTLGDLLRQDPAPTQRRQLLLNRARVGTLAGRLSFFDLQDPMAARAYYSLALEAAREAGDHLQAAAALAHVAFIPAAEHGFTAALDYLHGADEHLRSTPCGPIASWLAAVESEMHTNAANPTAALRALDRARDALAAPGLTPELPWFDYYDATRLSGFAGYATLRAGNYEDARTELGSALGKLARSAVKQRAVFLADLATVELHDGNLDHACKIASDAADQLHQAGYATGAGRLREFRAALQPWKITTPVRVLDEQLAALN
ncbi:MAG: helix-turn-helix transcriptional regulator [Pseudonocardiales bacterium]|nr:helix-turn-helix transcriptional regulator [Pseudonocardiales bacterium]MBV9032786.1 helix-turn-helix transcriptional regulator [Pseudonocardiales bacterium]